MRLWILVCLWGAVPAFGWKLTPRWSGLVFPVEVHFEPGTQTPIVVEQQGRLLKWDGKGWKPWVDLTGKVYFGGECGLLSLAFAPDYPKSGKYYLNYTARTPELFTYVVERKRDSTEQRTVLKFRQPYTNHNGGQLAFGPDRLLYIGVGDGGLAGDPLKAGQDTRTLLGKILRIDPNGEPYTIPKDNPFADGKSGAREVYAWGLRNPWRFSFDSATGALIAADVGQNQWEEVDRVVLGGNYGWNHLEGKVCYEPSKGCETKGKEDPLWVYGRAEGESITGGFVYRGRKAKAWHGAYIYGDYVSGRIWALHLDREQKKAVKNELLLKSSAAISSFGVDPDGEILVVDHGEGKIFTLAP